MNRPSAEPRSGAFAIQNGILARVGGQFVASGSERLPTPDADQEGQPTRAVDIPDVPDLGTVRITYRLNSYRHGRSRLWHWVAVHAEQVQ